MNASEDCGQNTYPKILVPAILIGDNYKAVLNKKILIIRDLCKIKKTFIEDDNSIKVGYSENKFLYFLNNQFGERIKTKKKVSNDFEAYFPDFIYYDNVRQIYLDIEIDEPYDLLEGKPIHCLFDDSRRDVFFIDHYWSVIRFSEKQIITSPDSCIKTIQSVITALEYGHDNWTIYIEKDDAWEEETAIKMEQEGFREKYLGIEKKTRSPKIETPFNSRVTRSFILSDEDLPF